MQAPQSAWDSDAVLKSYLKQETEPISDNLDPEVEAARLALTKIHLNDLREVHEQVPPRKSELLDVEKAGASFRFKVLAWKTFPADQLPIEILQHIFRLIIRPRVNYKNIDIHRLRLTSVCRHWRDVALADPLLWNVVYFRGPSNWERTTQFMHRAGNALLDVHVSDYQQRDSHERNVIPRISLPHIHLLFLVLSQRWHQVRAITFTIHDPTTSVFLLGKLTRCTRFHDPRNLEVLMLDIPVVDPESYPPISFPFGTAPRLNHFSMTGTGVDFASLPWAHKLTTLSLSHMPSHLFPTSERFLEVLASAPSLSSLTLDRFIPRTEHGLHFIPRTAIRLLKLRTLVIGNLSGREMQLVMSHFTSPNIKNLSLCYLTEVNDGSLAEFLQGRFPHITELFLEDVQFAPTRRAKKAFSKWMATMPKVTYLKLADFPPNGLSLSWFWEYSFSTGTAHIDQYRPTQQNIEKWSSPHIQRYSAHRVCNDDCEDEDSGDCGVHNAFHFGPRATTIRDHQNFDSNKEADRQSTAGLVLPQLSHVCLENISPTDVVAIVDGRRRAGRPLSDLTLAHPYMLPSYVVREIIAGDTRVNVMQDQDGYALMLSVY